MLGYSEMTETAVWLQTRRAATAQIRFWKQGKPETARLSDAVQTYDQYKITDQDRAGYQQFLSTPNE